MVCPLLLLLRGKHQQESTGGVGDWQESHRRTTVRRDVGQTRAGGNAGDTTQMGTGCSLTVEPRGCVDTLDMVVRRRGVKQNLKDLGLRPGKQAVWSPGRRLQ